MDLGVRKALTHIADRQQIKVRNVIIEGPPFPQLQLDGPRQQHNKAWRNGVTFYRKVLVGGLHEIAASDAPHLLSKPLLMDRGLRLKRGSRPDVPDLILRPRHVLDHRRAEHDVELTILERQSWRFHKHPRLVAELRFRV